MMDEKAREYLRRIAKRGGRKRAEILTQERRTEIARKAGRESQRKSKLARESKEKE